MKNKIKIEIYDDKKERYQSFEAKLIENNWDIPLEGYGENQDEAIEDLKKIINNRIEALSNIDFTDIVIKK